MPKPQERNQEETKVIFQSWLEEKLTTASDINVEILGGPDNTGFSNETLSFLVSYSLGDDVKATIDKVEVFSKKIDLRLLK